METDVILGICGVVGGLFTAAGDLLLDLKGKDNVSRGKYGFMDSAWDHMDIRRFQASILLAMVGCPLIFMGMIALARQLMLRNLIFGKIFFYISTVGFGGSFFIHTIICLFPVIYKTIRQKYGFEDAETVINKVYESVAIPFWIHYLAFVIIPAGMVIWALLAGYLKLSPAYILLTAPVFLGVSILLKVVKPAWFCDLPFVIAPSLSMSMLGLLALLNTL